MKRFWRPIAVVIILAATIAAFTAYFIDHPEVREQLSNTPLWLLVALLLGYTVFIGCLALINSATLRLCRVQLSRGESTLLTIYSSIINFFGPLQSGPAFRAVYVKRKHGVKLRNYTSATLIYYLMYAIFSGMFLLSGILGWWLLVLSILGVATLFLLTRSNLPQLQRFKQLKLGNWYFLAGATLLQVCIQAVIYYMELHWVAGGVSWSQVIVYTGAANFALFVAITPGAIGFRESFLLFSQNLHGIDSSAIIIANTIDRAVYVSLLLILSVGMFATHAQRRFKSNS